MALTHQKVFSTPGKTTVDLGLSWQLQEAAPNIIDKNGGTSKGGCQSYIGFIPGSNTGTTVLTNTFSPGYDATALGSKILGILASA